MIGVTTGREGRIGNSIELVAGIDHGLIRNPDRIRKIPNMPATTVFRDFVGETRLESVMQPRYNEQFVATGRWTGAGPDSVLGPFVILPKLAVLVASRGIPRRILLAIITRECGSS
jgi:hypothetical protein